MMQVKYAMPRTRKLQYYTVANGRNPGIYRTWAECKAQIDHHSGADFKKFTSVLEAQSYLKKGGRAGVSRSCSCSNASTVSSSKESGSTSYGDSSSFGGSIGGPSLASAPTKSKPMVISSPSLNGSISLYHGAPDDFRKASSAKLDVMAIPVYTDGACRGNGIKSNCIAGYGVYYPTGSHPNALVPITDNGNSTNQRAELLAVMHALTDVANDVMAARIRGEKPSAPYEVRTDSKYCINSITLWSNNWSKNGWRTSSGQPVQNQDIIKDTVAIYNYINTEYHEAGLGFLEMRHVNGHAGEPGNEYADKLANEGADMLLR